MIGEIKLEKKMVYKGKITLLTGLHIGGNKANMKIGGIDQEVVKKPNGEPYIPGSSIKGKMRALYEIKTEKYEKKEKHEGEPHSCKEEKCPICGLFGSKDYGKGRLIFRDCDLLETPIKEKEVYTESKMENVVNRISGKAANPRQIERVPAGTVFNFEVVLDVYKNDGDYYKKIFEEIIKLLEEDYLGGSGTRGYGKIKIEGEWKDIKEE